MYIKATAFSVCFAFFATTLAAQSQENKFQKGPLIAAFGPVATVEGHTPIPENTIFKVSFDIAEQAKAGSLNRSLVSGARFLNMHSGAGVAPENISLAFVIHGKAVHDVTNNAHYETHTGAPNANLALLETLISHGVRVEVCGQSAAYHGVNLDDLAPGVSMSLSAMTSHALFQQNGYTLNPF